MSEGGKMATKDDEAKREWFLKLSHQLLFLRDRGKINLEKVQTVQDFILLSNLFDHCELKNLTYDDGDAFVFSPNEYFAEFHKQFNKQFKKERESLFRERLDPVLGRYGRALQDCNEEQADRELALSNRIQGQIRVMCEDYEWAVKAVKYAMIGYGLAIASGLGLSPSELDRVRYAGIQGIDLAPMEYVITNLSGYGSLKEAKLKQLENLGVNEPGDESQAPADTGKGKRGKKGTSRHAGKSFGFSPWSVSADGEKLVCSDGDVWEYEPRSAKKWRIIDLLLDGVNAHYKKESEDGGVYLEKGVAGLFRRGTGHEIFHACVEPLGGGFFKLCNDPAKVKNAVMRIERQKKVK